MLIFSLSEERTAADAGALYDEWEALYGVDHFRVDEIAPHLCFLLLLLILT